MHRIIVTILLLTAAYVVQGQEHYLFNRYTTNDGLVSNKIYCTIQDRAGYLWVGTSNGLQRFDGKRFRTVPLKGNNRLATAIHSLALDSNGKIIVLAGPNLYSGAEIGIVDPATLSYQKLPVLAHDKGLPKGISRLYRDHLGTIFITASLNGVYELNPARNAVIESSLFKGLPKNWGVNYLYEDWRNGNYYLGTDSGLAIYDRRDKELYTHDYNPRNFTILTEKIREPADIKIDEQDRVWIVFADERTPNILCFDEKKGKFLPHIEVYNNKSSSKMEVYRLFATHNKKLWGVGFHNLLQYDGATNRFILYKDFDEENYNIKYEMAYDLFEDREGILWVCTSDGLYYFNPMPRGISGFMLSNTEKQLLIKLVQPNRKELWAATLGSTIYIADTSLRQWPSPQKIDLGNTWIASMLVGKTNNLVYVTSWKGDIICFDSQSKKIKNRIKSPFSANAPINGMAEDRYGNVWFIDRDRNLFELPAGKELDKVNLRLSMTLPDVAHSLIISPEGKLYLGTWYKGLQVIDLNTMKIIAQYGYNNDPNKSLSSDLITDVVQLNDSLFYVACSGVDILNIKNGRVIHLNLPDGMPAKAEKLALDNKGVLWFGNTQGLFSYDYKQNKCIKYSAENGFYITGSITAIYADNSGKVFFGDNSMITGFYPEHLISYTAAPPVALTEIRLFNTNLSVDSLLHASQATFAYNHNSFSFLFSTLSYQPGIALNYHYRLLGASHEWAKADASQSVTYSLLPPGNYTFEVYSDNGKGIKSNITSYTFRIRSPFWLTWWFITLCALLMAVIIYIIYRQHIQRLLAIQQVRQRVARDLHDDMGSTLSSIKILSTIAEEKLDADNNTKPYLTKIKDNSTSMMEAMNYIVWSINPNNDSMQKVLARMRSFAVEVVESKGMTLSFTADKSLERLQLDIERKRDLFLIYKEAINNAVKYSEGTDINIKLTLKQNHIELIVQDNGKGFSPGKVRGEGNGLDNMHKRALALHGSLVIDSSPGNGTTLTLVMPSK